VLGQGHALLEVLLCPVAVPTESVTAALGDVRDVRLRRLPDHPTWAAAATAGARAARGEHLLFLRGCDLLAPDAVARAAGSLAASGAHLATGLLEQTGHPEPWLATAQREAHAEPDRGVVPADRPPLAGDLAIGNKLLRRRAWLAGPGGFGPDDDWLLSPAVAAVLAAAPGVDVLDSPFSTYAHDHGFRPYSATPSPWAGLAAWQRRTEAVADVLSGSPLAPAWEHQLAAVELPRFLVDAERATPAQWATLQRLAAELVQRLGAAPAGSSAAARALVRLAAQDRRTDVAAVAAEVAGLGDDLPTTRDGERVLVAWASGLELPPDARVLSVAETPARAHAQRTRWAAGGREVDLLVEVRHVDLGPDTEVLVEQHGTGPAGAGLPTRALPHDEATRWAGRRFQRAAGVRVTVPGDAATTLRLTVRRGDLVRHGALTLPGRPVPPASAPVVVSGLELDDDVLVVHARGGVEDLAGLRLLDSRDRRVPVHVDPRPDEGVVRVELRTERFGVPTWLAGPHRLVTDRGNVAVAEPLRGRLPLAPGDELRGERHRVRAHLGPRGGLVLGLGPPLADDEVGAFAQEQLRAGYARTGAAVDPDLFYFETYAGRTATDSPLAILEELRRRRPGLRALWGISDHSQRAPEGTTPVLLRSRAWYDALATAGVLVLNTDVEAWFHRRPDQFLLQTFHGYPSKAMGRGQWEALDHSPSRIATFRARGVDTWSAILTPTPEMTRHYREQYDYDGPALERGYPRDDDLVGPGAEARRRATRRTLGIEEHQTAVLYAPTWREHLATRPRAAAMTDHLDVAEAAEALGPEHVLLLRGHRFHDPVGVPAGRGRVVDVTAYPEINDLVLASDAAVLDYSSLRFDYALTGRPMVFLVPDLEEYDAGSRSFLFPFAPTAPGPFVRDTAGVVAALRDLPALRREHADAIAAVNAEFNPWADGHAAERVVDGLLALLADGAGRDVRGDPP
jgi:CDP-glycerol glycerophosphotransferase (TagB/SpsB family)